MLRVSLNGGEVSTKMQGRVDLPVYQSSAVECKNFVVDIEGGIRRRSGFEFCGFAKRDDGVVRVFPFRYSVADQLVLEVGRGYIRFWRGNELVLRSDGSVYELESPWLDDVVLEGLRIEQVNDVMWFVSPEAPPVVLERFGELDWRLRVIEFLVGPWEDSAKNKEIMQYQLLGDASALVRLVSREGAFTKEMVNKEALMRLSIDRPEKIYNQIGLSAMNGVVATTAHPGMLAIGDLTNKLHTTNMKAGYSFYQALNGWYYYFTSRKEWTGATDAVLGADARAYPDFFAQGVVGGIDYGAMLNSMAVMLNSIDLSKRVIIKAGQILKTKDSLFSEYILCLKDFRCWRVADGGDVNPNSEKLEELYRHRDFFDNPHVFRYPDFPFDVRGGWEITTEGSWDAEWEVRRSYDAFRLDLTLDQYDWSRIRSFSQGVLGERKNFSLSGVEEEPCLIGLFCLRSKSLTVASMGNPVFKTLGTRADMVVGLKNDVSKLPYEVVGSVKNQSLLYDRSGISNQWGFSAFGVRNGYPRAVVIHQGRLWFGGTKGAPTGLWGSASDDFYNFRAGSNDGDAVSVSLNSGEQSAVAWLSSARHLLVGSEGAEWVVSGGQDGVIKPSTIEARIQSRVGSLGGHVCDTYAGVCYVGRNGRQMWNMAYSWEAESWTSRNLTKYASHLFVDSSARKIEFMKGACDLIWVLSGGGLASCSLSADDGVQAWAQHSLGAAARVEDICVSGDTTGESVLNVVARLGESSRVCILRWKDEGVYFCDFWSEASGAAVLPPAEYVSRYKTSRFELPDDASSRRGAVMLRLDVDRSYADGVKVGVGNILKPFSYTVGKVFDGWCESGVSGHWENGLSVEIEACGEHGFSLRGIMLLVQ